MATASIVVPEGFTLHTENTSHLLVNDANDTFLNPIQEFNRDLSVACITVWSEEYSDAKNAKWIARHERQGPPAKKSRPMPIDDKELSSNGASSTSPKLGESVRPYKFAMLEPLSATGLRSIRFAKEIPLLNVVVANDISASAVETIKRNVEINGVGSTDTDSTHVPDEPRNGKVKIVQGDACSLMYSHRIENTRVDCIDLDPYGTVSPFIDAAVQAIAEDGLLCITCTDLAVLGTNNYPEKCFANYGGVPAKAEFCHEVALRLILNLISTTASRYGKFIKPVLSLSIDFYARLFVQVRSAPIQVKKAVSRTGITYVCSFCQAFSVQPLGREVVKVSESGNANTNYRAHSGPPCGITCNECNSAQHLAGPMWIGPLHDQSFVSKVLVHLESRMERYRTSERMKGMLTLAREELEVPFYFTPTKIASFFNCISPRLEDVVSALLNAGHQVSRSHASAGSLKTTASHNEIHNIFRTWIHRHPVTMKNIADDSPKRVLLSKSVDMPSNFDLHPQAALICSGPSKLVRYQQNPTADWGPGTKARQKDKSAP